MPGSEEKVEIRTSKDDDSLACAGAGFIRELHGYHLHSNEARF